MPRIEINNFPVDRFEFSPFDPSGKPHQEGGGPRPPVGEDFLQTIVNVHWGRSQTFPPAFFCEGDTCCFSRAVAPTTLAHPFITDPANWIELGRQEFFAGGEIGCGLFAPFPQMFLMGGASFPDASFDPVTTRDESNPDDAAPFTSFNLGAPETTTSKIRNLVLYGHLAYSPTGQKFFSANLTPDPSQDLWPDRDLHAVPFPSSGESCVIGVSYDLATRKFFMVLTFLGSGAGLPIVVGQTLTFTETPTKNVFVSYPFAAGLGYSSTDGINWTADTTLMTTSDMDAYLGQGSIRMQNNDFVGAQGRQLNSNNILRIEPVAKYISSIFPFTLISNFVKVTNLITGKITYVAPINNFQSDVLDPAWFHPISIGFQLDPPFESDISQVAYHNGVFCAGGGGLHAGNGRTLVALSLDGLHWTPVVKTGFIGTPDIVDYPPAGITPLGDSLLADFGVSVLMAPTIGHQYISLPHPLRYEGGIP